jgi:hypothetical protein
LFKKGSKKGSKKSEYNEKINNDVLILREYIQNKIMTYRNTKLVNINQKIITKISEDFYKESKYNLFSAIKYATYHTIHKYIKLVEIEN